MLILLVIIGFHALVILRAKTAPEGEFPTLSVLLLSALMVAAVAFLMTNMKVPG
ncbi:hypothetical protein [Gracilimonas tropica]|uniref:hypothetical protein n=1 Tax=Gracilimonas tropica TaxID=454600 RepID=UPI0003627129|nr:hypothetical protein [Gracilimonas tropica]